ncbi:MAG TPA: RNA polymerase sigma factor [Acidimicrobiia bacterium]
MSSAIDSRQRFETIVDEVFDPLQRYIRRRIDADRAEDVLADVLMTAWRRLEDAPSDHVLPWCYGIARRTLANARRGQRRHLRLVQRLQAEPKPESVLDPAEAGPDSDLSEALDSLSDDDREILRLWAWEQLEPREIAPVLDISVNAATLRLSRARSRLADQLPRQDEAVSGHETVEGTREQP